MLNLLIKLIGGPMEKRLGEMPLVPVEAGKNIKIAAAYCIKCYELNKG